MRKHEIVKVTVENYFRFDALVKWRMTGVEQCHRLTNELEDELIKVPEAIKNPNLNVYTLEVEGKWMGWISIVYVPKVGRWENAGHLYVDELWVEPSYRGNGYALELLKIADVLADEMGVDGIRLYVDPENPAAVHLYKKQGYEIRGNAYFMEKNGV